MGMKARRDIIGDTGPNHFSHWDPIWNDRKPTQEQHVHILVSINGKTEADAGSALPGDQSSGRRGGWRESEIQDGA